MKSAFVAVLLCSSLIWARSGETSAETLAITNVNVVDTREGRIGPNVTVIVRDGTILAIAKVAVLDPGPHVRIINGGGRYLIPGLWDMNTHLSGPAISGLDRSSLFALFLINGVTGVRDMEHREQGLTLPDVLRPEIVGPEIVGPEINRPEVNQPEVNQPEVNQPEISRPEVAGNKSATPVQFGRSLEDLDEVMLTCSSREQEFRQNSALTLDGRDAIKREIRASYDPKKASDLFLDLSNHATWIVPSLVSVDASAASSPPEMLQYLPSSLVVPETDEDEPDFQLEKKQESARDMLLVHDMAKAGLQFMAGSNSPGINLVPGFSLHRELQLLVKSGFSPLQALQAATLNPAIFMAELDKYGVVEPGRIANLVLLEDNPLTDIHNVSKIAGVVLRGVYFSRVRLQQILPRRNTLTSQELNKPRALDPGQAQ
jgi:hypothetical protein